MTFVCTPFIAYCLFFFFKQKTAYEMRISDWSSDVCSSDLTFYHSLSLSRDVADRFRITLGVANLFDTPPPRVSTVVTATPPVIGQAPAFGTQYDYLGRRFFLGVRGKI